MNIKKKIKFKLLLINYKEWFLLLGIFLLFLFTRFYELETKNGFAFDQASNAWMAKEIIVDHKFPLLGMVAKGNSGFNIGPSYNYMITIFYWIFNLDPIASPVFASVTAIFTFIIIFYLIKKLFSFKIALLAVFIYTISFAMIKFDRTQWPVGFIPALSLIIFYTLYNVLLGKQKYLLLLAIALGFSFHIHFTSVFYLIIILFSLPFFKLNKQWLKYAIISIPLFLIWFIPNIVATLNNKSSQFNNLLNYLNTYYHGLHLTRFFQLTKDAFIKFEEFIPMHELKFMKYFLLPFFLIIYYLHSFSKERFIFCYLVALWFLIPWIIFTTYAGEISDYYFSSTIPIVIIILAYLFFQLFRKGNIIIRLILIFFLIYYSAINFINFINLKEKGLYDYRKDVIKTIKQGGNIEFKEGSPEYYLFYLYTQDERFFKIIKQ